MSKCDHCYHRTDTWSEKLKEQGLNVCNIVLVYKANFEDIIKDQQDWFDYIDVDQIGFGWIKIGGMCYNEQPILKNVKKCKWFERKL